MRNDRYCLPVLASSRGRVPGIVHDRSGSGQTVFVEPLEVIEANNDLALLAAEERREIDRLLGEFGRAVLGEADRLLDAVDALAALDALEAKVAFGEMGEGRLPEISDDGNWTLVAARHPLLDARFEKLRRRVLGESRERSDAVPLDFALPADRRLLVVSGPNAGGKTVVLKTAGLFSMLAQCGIPIPADVGTRLPVFRAIRTEIGDAQAILSDRSTFSSSMETPGRHPRRGGPGHARPDRRDRRRDRSRGRQRHRDRAARGVRRPRRPGAGHDAPVRDQDASPRRAPTRSARRWSSTMRRGGPTTGCTRDSPAAATPSRSPASAASRSR